jgi:hypothetical protein
VKWRSAEAICTKHVNVGRGIVRWWKRLSSKLMRRMGKEDPEAAPTKLPKRGYTD